MKLLVIGFLSFLASFPLVSPGYAHSGEGLIEDYIVSYTQEPLSPFVGDTVKASIIIRDKNGDPVSDLEGELIVKQLVVDEYVGEDPEQSYKEIYNKKDKTDLNGTVTLEYIFGKEAAYDVEFHWRDDEENQSAGMQILPRNKSQSFSEKNIIKNVWLMTGVAMAGIIIGSIGTFILLTATLHPKK